VPGEAEETEKDVVFRIVATVGTAVVVGHDESLSLYSTATAFEESLR
jgi:hypothetical protein